MQIQIMIPKSLPFSDLPGHRSGSTYYSFLFLCCYSATKLCLILCDPMDCSTPGFHILYYLLEFVQTHVHWVADAIQPPHPVSSPSPALNLSQHQGLFQWVGSCFRWPYYWSFSLSISPSNEYSGLISFSIDWFDLLAVQGTLKSLLQHHSLKCSAFFMVQLSHPYMTTDCWEPYKAVLLMAYRGEFTLQ